MDILSNVLCNEYFSLSFVVKGGNDIRQDNSFSLNKLISFMSINLHIRVSKEIVKDQKIKKVIVVLFIEINILE